MTPFTASRRDGKLIIEIDERDLLASAAGDPDNNLRVTDREQFLRFVTANFFTLTHDLDRDGHRASWWQRLTEALGKAAAATDQGVRQNQVAAPTCGCDPEEHDGG